MSSIALTDDPLSELPDESPDRLTIPSRMTEDSFTDWYLSVESIRAEWVDGEVILMSPVSTQHARIFVWLDRVLGTYVQERDLGEVLGSEVAVRLQAHQRVSRRVPDLMFVRKDRLQLLLKTHLEGPPDLAIEIVSYDSKARDWTDKLQEYEAAGIREYWIVDPLRELFEGFALDQIGKFVSIFRQNAGLFESRVVDGFRFQVDWLWQEILPSPLNVLKGLGVSA